MFAVITQEESEPKLLSNANPIMAHPLCVPRFPKKRLFQCKLWAKKEDAPVPEPDFINVPSHIHGSTKVQGYKKYTTPAKSNGKNKSNPRKRLDKPNFLSFPKPNLNARHLFNWQTLCASSISKCPPCLQ